MSANKTSIVFLAKASNDLISFCTCKETLIGAPMQMDDPWCGCGWLHLCPKCRKTFTFARAEEVSLTWEQLAHRDLDGKWGRQPTPEEVREWIDFMKVLLQHIQVGKQYVYVDGYVFSTDQAPLSFEGMHARHALSEVPQVAALKDPASLDRTLASKDYWQARRVEGR